MNYGTALLNHPYPGRDPDSPEEIRNPSCHELPDFGLQAVGNPTSAVWIYHLRARYFALVNIVRIRKVGEQHIVARQRKYVSDDIVRVGRLGVQ